MKRISVLLGPGLLLLVSTVLILAKPAQGASYALTKPHSHSPAAAWEFSFQEWDCHGSFDYFLHYANSSKLLSHVSFPQNQRITVLNLKYALPENHGFLKLQYGKSGAAIKGRGFDSDWTHEDSSALTDYGELDSYGKQQQFSIGYEQILLKNGIHRLSLWGGWGKQETTNELRNVVYYLDHEISSAGDAQDDIGSSLNGESGGFQLGLNANSRIASRLTLNTGLSVAFLKTKAYGQWNNHYPAWNWTNTGNTIGYEANIGLQYMLIRNASFEIKYNYNYCKSTGCEEILNGSLKPELVDLKYVQKGLVVGINYTF